jgi:hypothetical protein
MDTLVRFTLPSLDERLQFVIQQFSNQLIDFLSSEEKQMISHIGEHIQLFKETTTTNTTAPQDSTRSALLRELLFLSSSSFNDLTSQVLSTDEESEIISFSSLQSLFDEMPVMISNDWKSYFSPEMDNHHHSSFSTTTSSSSCLPDEQQQTPMKNNSAAAASSSSSSSSTPFSLKRNPVKLSESHRKRNSFSSAAVATSVSSPSDAVTMTSAFLSKHLSSFNNEDCFDVKLCLKIFLLFSKGWSFRDINKKLMNIRYQVLCSERFVAFICLDVFLLFVVVVVVYFLLLLSFLSIFLSLFVVDAD